MKLANVNDSTCSMFKKNIRAFVDEELPVNIRSAFLEHASKCRDCALELKAIHNIRKTMAKLKRVTVSPEFDFRMKISICREHEKLRNPFYVMKLFLHEHFYKLVALPALGVIVAFSFISFNNPNNKLIQGIYQVVSKQFIPQTGVDLISGDGDESIGEQRYVLERVKPIDVERGIFLNELVTTVHPIQTGGNVVLVSY